MSEFILEVARHNPSLARSLRALRKRAESTVRDAEIADTVLDARDSIPSAGDGSQSGATRPTDAPASLASSSLSGEGLGADSLADNPLRTLRALDFTTITPLAELDALATRAGRVLRKRRGRLRLSLILGGVFAGVLLGVGVYSLATENILVGALLIVLAAAFVAAAQLLWRPFERAHRTQRLTQLADAMAADIAGRTGSLDQIHDLSARRLSEWKAVIDLTEEIAKRA